MKRGIEPSSARCPKILLPTFVRKAFIDSKGQSPDGNKSGGSGKPQKGTQEYHCKQREVNSCSMVNGLLYIKCKTCGLNTNHGSQNHDQYVKNPLSFRLNAMHFYTKECNRLGQGYSGTMNTVLGMSPPSSLTVPTLVQLLQPGSANSSLILIKTSKLESMLADYERTSMNPNL